MPIPPPAVSAPYDTAETVLEFARVKLNDMIQQVGGDTLTDTAPFTYPAFLAAYERLQEELADLGDQRMTSEFTGYGYPAAGSLDPALRTYLSWTQFFDGEAYWTNVDLLPQDFMQPLKVRQRPAGQICRFVEFDCAPQGLPSEIKLQWNRHWLWKEDALWMTGSTQSMDLQMDYIAYLPDITANYPNPGLSSWTEQQVPIMRCRNALAYYLAAEISRPRGDVDAQALEQLGDLYARKIVNRQYRSRMRVNQRRRSYRRSASHTGWSSY